jgi:glycosyltransferase involved in cell wall biosynthesis
MRVAHVLTYVSSDGAYGGPLAVMVAHCRELAARGHHVEVFAGWDGQAELSIPGVKVNLFRVRRGLPIGFSGLVSGKLVRTVRRRAVEFDVVHVHLSRDLITAPTALAVLGVRRGPKVFVQTHGMIKPDLRPVARVMDLAIRSILRRSASVLALNRTDAERVDAVGRSALSIVELPNGVPAQEDLHNPGPGVPEFIFLARLQPRKRVMLFAEAAALVTAAGVEARFTVVGPDEGDLTALLDFISQRRLEAVIRYEGALPPGAAPARLAEADVYVLPSLNEPFPMTVLEAMSVGVPCIISTSCHIADRLAVLGGVVTFDHQAAELAGAITSLATDRDRRVELGKQAALTVTKAFGVSSVVDVLEHYYSMDRAELERDERQLAAGVGQA